MKSLLLMGLLVGCSSTYTYRPTCDGLSYEQCMERELLEEKVRMARLERQRLAQEGMGEGVRYFQRMLESNQAAGRVPAQGMVRDGCVFRDTFGRCQDVR